MTGVWQLIRYGLVGLGVNLAAFLAYLLLTNAGIGPKAAMSVLYFLAVLISFTFNRNWTFDHRGEIPSALVRYLGIYAFGYALNWGVLYVLVDINGWPHEWVQGCMIFVLAALLFVLQKLWVFRNSYPS